MVLNSAKLIGSVRNPKIEQEAQNPQAHTQQSGYTQGSKNDTAVKEANVGCAKGAVWAGAYEFRLTLTPRPAANAPKRKWQHRDGEHPWKHWGPTKVTQNENEERLDPNLYSYIYI